MTNQNDPTEPSGKSAKEIRALMAEKELEEAKRDMEKHGRAEKVAAEFKDYFMSSEVTEDDRQRIAAKIERLAEKGQTEMCVLTFPSDFCNDGGRAVNNLHTDWKSTLTGQAAKIYDLWEQVGKPLDFKLEARVLNYPKGIIGDIGLFVKW